MGFATDVAAHINLCRVMDSTGTQCTSGQKCQIFIRNVKLHLKQGILLVNTESNTAEFL